MTLPETPRWITVTVEAEGDLCYCTYAASAHQADEYPRMLWENMDWDNLPGCYELDVSLVPGFKMPTGRSIIYQWKDGDGFVPRKKGNP